MNREPPRRSVLRALLSALTRKAPEQAKQHVQPLRHLAPDDHNVWHAYWKEHGQLWRTEPEIDAKRQQELTARRDILPDIGKGIYPFSGMKLSRADVEWLLATHENGQGPVNWGDSTQHGREGLDLRGADLRGITLNNLPLTCLRGGLTRDELSRATEEQIEAAAVHMEGALLKRAHLEAAILRGAHLEGADLREASLEKADLGYAQLQEAECRRALMKETSLSFANLEGTLLWETRLERADLSAAQGKGVNLSYAHLENANLYSAYLENANFFGSHAQNAALGSVQLKNAMLGRAQLEGADLTNADLEDANLNEAQLVGADLRGVNFTRAILRSVQMMSVDLRSAYFERTILNDIRLGNEKQVGPLLADAQWNTVNLAVVKWLEVKMLGDEYEAIQKRSNGAVKDKKTRLEEFAAAARANRQLATTLQTQGLNENAVRFAYHAQVLQKSVFWFQMLQRGVNLGQRLQALGSWLFSWFLFLLAGYGYKPGRSFLAYLLVIGTFAALYLLLTPHLAWYEAIVVSMTAFHGRGFSPSTFSPGDPLSIASAVEAFVGLIIEVTFIATLTRRFFGP